MRSLPFVQRVACAAALVALAARGFAQQPAHVSAESVAKLCTAAATVQVPPSILPTPAQVARLAPGCSQLGLYYAATPEHFRQARLCGLAQWQRQLTLDARHDDSPRVASSEFLALAMIFCNGDGVSRNVPLARRFACLSGDDGFTDVDSVLQDLGAGKLEVCSEDGSPYGRQVNYQCLLVLQGKVAEELSREEQQAQRLVSPGRWAAWRQLQSQRDAYLDAHNVELPNGNTGAVQSGMDDLLNLDRAWIAVLRAFEKGDLPQDFVQAGAFADVDKQLNVQYAERLKDAATYPELLNPTQLRIAERAWLRYREAWVQFGTANWPNTRADQWRAWLTAQRLEEMG